MPSSAAVWFPLCPGSFAPYLLALAHSWHNGGLVVRRSVAFAWRTCLFTARAHCRRRHRGHGRRRLRRHHRQRRIPSGLDGGFATPPKFREFVTDEAELLGEVVSVGAASAEQLHADSVLTECSPVGLVEGVAWLAAGAGVTVWV